jgi:chromosomal replication initiator protein
MYLTKLLTQKSLLEIGKFFGGRDHATVIHAVKRIESLIKNDTQIIEDINIITKKLK